MYSHVVDKTRDWLHLSGAFASLPGSDHLDEEVVAEAGEQHLADQEDVGGEGGLEHDRHVGGVEKADWVRAAHATLTRGLDWNLNTEALEVDDSAEDGNGG